MTHAWSSRGQFLRPCAKSIIIWTHRSNLRRMMYTALRATTSTLMQKPRTWEWTLPLRMTQASWSSKMLFLESMVACCQRPKQTLKSVTCSKIEGVVVKTSTTPRSITKTMRRWQRLGRSTVTTKMTRSPRSKNLHSWRKRNIFVSKSPPLPKVNTMRHRGAEQPFRTTLPSRTGFKRKKLCSGD